MTDPASPPESTSVVADEPRPDLQPPPARGGAVPPVPGDRLGVPLGATRHVPDYGRAHPSYGFLAVVSAITLALDIATKSWAARHLDRYPGSIEVWKNHLSLVLARNRGGAWGLLQTTSENVRRPFFLLVSIAAIVFIMTLYRRLLPRQRALRWGLPLVLGGALGNVYDRIRYGQVIDFIDAHAIWHGIDHHWPTFNVADIAICVGVGLMAVDMFTSKRGNEVGRAPRVPPSQSGEPAADFGGVVPGPDPDESAAAGPADGGAPYEAIEPADAGTSPDIVPRGGGATGGDVS